MTCKRCGADTPRLTLAQRYCPQCQRDVDAKLAPRPEPAFLPVWRRHPMAAKDLTGLHR